MGITVSGARIKAHFLKHLDYFFLSLSFAADIMGDQAFGNEETSEGALACAAARRWLDRQGATLIESLADAERCDERERARRRLHNFLSRRGFGPDVIRVGMEEAEAGAREVVGRGDAPV